MTEERVEHLLAEVQDEFGIVRVLEVADYRFLEFGDAIEQSCVFTSDPSWLEYDYTRAMLIGALCHEQPESALFLGLGAGTLTQACLRFLPLEDVEAIELRRTCRAWPSSTWGWMTIRACISASAMRWNCWRARS